MTEMEQQSFTYRSEAEYNSHVRQMSAAGWDLAHYEYNPDKTMLATWTRDISVVPIAPPPIPVSERSNDAKPFLYEDEVAKEERLTSVGLVEAFDLCTQWSYEAKKAISSAGPNLQLLSQLENLMEMPGVSWLKRRRYTTEMATAAERINELRGMHDEAVENINVIADKIEEAVRSDSVAAPTLTLPVVQTSLVLPYDETAHFEGPGSLEKVLTRRTDLIHGELIVTDRRVLFDSANGIHETPIANLMRVSWSMIWPNEASVTFAGKSGSFKYYLSDAVRVALLLRILVRIQNRHIVPTAQQASRHIPQQVKIAVWQRDKGRCVQCGSDQYLEFDHIIPWSKGGASSVENLQLLCRGCNAIKGDRL